MSCLDVEAELACDAACSQVLELLGRGILTAGEAKGLLEEITTDTSSSLAGFRADVVVDLSAVQSDVWMREGYKTPNQGGY